MATALDRARGYVGTRERGYNRGELVDYFNRTTGVPPGSSWCLAFGFTVYEEAAQKLHVRNPLLRTGAVWRLAQYAKSIQPYLRIVPVHLARPGAILFAKRSGGRGTASDVGRVWLGHAALKISDKGMSVRSVEGNTSAGTKGSQRDGGQVADRWRLRSWWLGAIEVQPIEVKPSEAPQ